MAAAARTPPVHLPAEVDGWQVATATSFARQLAYAELVAYLQKHLSLRDNRVIDFFEQPPSVHVPILYYDVRNHLKYTSGPISSTRVLRQAAARALFLLIRTLQDVIACEHAFGETKWQVAAQLHKKLCGWLRQHHVQRVLVAPPTPPRSSTATAVEPQFGGPPALAGAGSGSGGARALRGRRRSLSPPQLDFGFTGWFPSLSFGAVLQQTQKMMQETATSPQPLPVWVLAMGGASMIWFNTMYFNNSDPKKIAAATGNTKIDSIRAACARALLQLWGARQEGAGVRTWEQFHGLEFSPGCAFVTELTRRTRELAATPPPSKST